MSESAWSRAEFYEQLRAKRASYHLEHPFQVLMNDGKLSPAQLRGWVLNRFYYQRRIPQKDAAILANCDNAQVRRAWVKRLLHHDGSAADEGGIEAWLQLGEACGLSREEMIDERRRPFCCRCVRQFCEDCTMAGRGLLITHRAVRG